MVTVHPVLTPRFLLSAPRRSAGVPSPSGRFVAFTVSTYSFESHSKQSLLEVVDTKRSDFYEVVSSLNVSIDGVGWLDEENFIFLQGGVGAEKVTDVVVAKVKLVNDGSSMKSRIDKHVAGSIPGPAGNLKVARASATDDKTAAFVLVVSAEATPDGKLYNPATAPKRHTTGRLYNDLFVRHWDRWETPEKNSLFVGHLSFKGGKSAWAVSGWVNALKGTGLESPIRPFGGQDNFDVCPEGIVFVAKAPEVNPALSTKCGVWTVKFSDLEQPSPAQGSAARRLLLPLHFKGAVTSPAFAPGGEKIAFLAMREDGYEADKNQIFIIGNIWNTEQVLDETRLLRHGEMRQHGGSWDRSPGSVVWTERGNAILLVADDEGTGRAFLYPVDKPHTHFRLPQPITTGGNVTDLKPLQGGRLFISSNSFFDSSKYQVLEVAENGTDRTNIHWSHSASKGGSTFSLSQDQATSIRTAASDPSVNRCVHSLVLYPPHFDMSKTYPVAYLIHGGPQGAWSDAWSTRWNPAVFAAQGYIVVMPNITGSTGYGQAFTDAIQYNWGGDPYKDLVNVFEWVGKHLKGADNERAVALGASYGGYMINWLQGHDLGRKFKALVCHDGIASTANEFATEELYFPFHDLGRPAWAHASDDRQANSTSGQLSANGTDAWKKWDPSAHYAKWSTPQLTIHSALDYRLPESEGLAAFNVLQTRGVESQLLVFPDENHWVLKPENSLLWHHTVLKWINRFAGVEGIGLEDEDEDSP